MTKTIYFNGLNGIRAIAALIVVIWHTDQLSYLFHVTPKKIYLTGMATRAVDIFFVLSGFLITFLLLKEKEKTSTIDIKKFYMRRILRIWPLYYFIIFLSVVLMYFNIVPKIESIYTSLFFYIFLMANVSYSFNFYIKSIKPLWSIGVEEQFYFIWPNLIKRITNYLPVFLGIFIGGCILRILLFYLIRDSYPNILNFMYMFRINVMALGALGAFLYYNKHSWLTFFYRKEVQTISWAVLFVSILYQPLQIRGYINSEINAVFYFVIILNVATNPKTIISLENKIFNTIGKFSYGIYMYHMTIIYFLSYLYNLLNLDLNYYLIQLFVLIFTFIISKVSYKYLESRFLNLKYKFTIVNNKSQMSNEKI